MVWQVVKCASNSVKVADTLIADAVPEMFDGVE